jgi:uncharacterized membrane protein
MDRGRDLRHMRGRLPPRRIVAMMKMVLYLHIAGGSMALASMAIPLLARKGARVHRASGWVFVGGMAAVSLTALALAAARYLTDPRPEARAFALFLFYIAILTGEGVSSGIRALRTKDRAAHRRYAWDIGLASVLTATAIAMAGYGVASGHVLFALFSTIGLANGIQGLVYWLRPPTNRMHWWFHHMTSMLGSCIAATTAFLVVNAPFAGVSRGSLIVWMTPAIVGGTATRIWTRYYRGKFSGSRRAMTDTSPAAAPADPYRLART